MPPSQHLPNFDQATIDQRFVAELDRLRQAGAFSSTRELTDLLDVRSNIVNEITAGRAHCSLRLLYTLAQYYPTADIQRILFGDVGTSASGPAR